MTEAGNDIVETVPMPDPIRERLRRSSPSTMSSEEFFKRKRDRANPEALGRAPAGRRGDDE